MKGLLKILRSRNLSQYRLAKMSGVSQASISAYCNEVSTPNISTAQKLAAALGVSVGELIDEKPKRVG